MNGIIYLIRNRQNHKGYVGKTINPEERFRKHRCGNSGSEYLNRAVRKGGWENFSLEILEEVPEYQLAKREEYWIQELGTFTPAGYNLTLGGEGVPGLQHTEESRRNMSAHSRGECHPMYGKHHSEETKRKISEAHKRLKKRKQFCLRGHPYDKENTYVDSNGKRFCRACDREKHRRRRIKYGNRQANR